MRTPILAASLVILSPTIVAAQDTSPSHQQVVTRAGSVAANPVAPGRAAFGQVTFAAGARSRWHTHPAGQTLYVLKGCGLTQQEGGPVMRICAGDTVYTPPGVKHWHGAAPDGGMVQLSATETVDGRNVDWLEPVTDGQYHQAPVAPR